MNQKSGLNGQMGVLGTDFTFFTCCQRLTLPELHVVFLTPEKCIQITKDPENVNYSVQTIPKTQCTTQSTCPFLLMGDNVPVFLGVYMPTS